MDQVNNCRVITVRQLGSNYVTPHNVHSVYVSRMSSSLTDNPY